ncbi:MAG: AMP-binding protein, partial [Cyanobacteria bacterium REEB65]|nr:AMP-binding protein [Cyanobacteria bacterium REEB65]
FQMPEATREAIDATGWLHTGDIGELDGDGYLKITDRKKEILVMSNGKNVAPAPIENALISSPFISQAVVLGDNRNFVSALVVPNFERLVAWARDRQLPTDPAVLGGEPAVRSLLRAEIDRVTAEFARFEKIKEFAILAGELSQERGELTPTLKIKRRVVHEHYRAVIDSLYSPPAPLRA